MIRICYVWGLVSLTGSLVQIWLRLQRSWKTKKERKKWHKGYVEKAASGMFLRLKERTSRTCALIIMREKRRKKTYQGIKLMPEYLGALPHLLIKCKIIVSHI